VYNYNFTNTTPTGGTELFLFSSKREVEKKGYAEKKRSNYYPFGSIMPNRHGNSESYRYGWNGAQKDDEIFNSTGTSYDLGARMYDPRIGRMRSTDPWTAKYPWQSPFVYHKNSPIASIDWKGLGGPGDRKTNTGISEHGKSNKSKAGTAHKEGIYADVSMTKGNTNNPDKAFPDKIAKDNNLTTQQLYALNPGLEENRHSIGQGQFIRTIPDKGKEISDYKYISRKEEYDVTIMEAGGNAYVAGGGSIMNFCVSPSSLSWESGSYNYHSTGVGASTTPGASATISFGTMDATIGLQNNYSIKSALEKSSVTSNWQGGFVLGINYTSILSSDYTVDAVGFGLMTPGAGVTVTTGVSGTLKETGYNPRLSTWRNPLRTTRDSIIRNNQILSFPQNQGSKYHQDFRRNHQ